MIRLLRNIILILMIVVLALPGTALAAGGDGILEGRLRNGTPAGGSVGGYEITLKIFRNDAEVSSEKTTADAEGWFVFSGLETDYDYSYQVTTAYQEAEYEGDRLLFDSGGSKLDSVITVYDSTIENDNFNVTMAYTIVYTETEMGGICVEEYYQVYNTSNLTYIGSGEITATGTRRTLEFPVPGGATNLGYGGDLMECCILASDAGFSDTMPIMPGTRELTYSYHIDTTDTEYAFSLPVNYPTTEYTLLVQGENVLLNNDRLVQTEQARLENSLFNHYTGSNLAPGDLVEATIFGLPEPSQQNSVIWTLVVLLVLGSGFTLYYLKKKNRRLKPARAGGYHLREEDLLAELARLDDAFEDGKITEGIYQRTRARTKSQLSVLIDKNKKDRKS